MRKPLYGSIEAETLGTLHPCFKAVKFRQYTSKIKTFLFVADYCYRFGAKGVTFGINKKILYNLVSYWFNLQGQKSKGVQRLRPFFNIH